MQIRELLHDYPPADEPEYREMLRQGFQKPAAVFLGRDDGKLRCENILGESAIFKAGAASLFAIGNSELVADELRELVSRIASIGRATVPLLLRDVILVASQRDFVRVSPSVLVREISAQQQDESPWVSGFERVVYFLSLPGFSCRKIPPKMKPFLTYLENICVGNTGYHFGRIIIEPNADIESALEAFQRAGVIALPPHRSATPVQAEVIRTLQDLAPDIGARLGDMTHDILARAYAARGFAPIAPPK
ncbi:MAG: hypothetical protein ACRD4M_15035 [Candidatus Acidiferrales bacterium]